MGKWKFVGGLALMSLVGGALAQSSPDLLPPPPGSVCPAPTVSTEPGNVHAFPGRWWNPQRNGIGWDFFYGEGQRDMYLTWFTYDPQGRPVWLHGEAQPLQFNPITGERTWQSRLYVAQWTFTAQGRTLTPVGAVSVTYPNQTTTRAAVRWRWNVASSIAPVGSLTYDECIFDTFRDQRALHSRGTINQAFSSNWFYRGLPDDPLVGWGVDLLVDRIPSTGAYVETAAAAIFDVDGRPVWLQSTDDDWGTSPPADDTLTATDKGKLHYFRYPVVAGVHPAVTVCDDADCGPDADHDTTLGPETYGVFGRLIEAAGQGRMKLTAQVPHGVTGIGAVDWPPPDAVQDPNLPIEVPVMRFDANHVVVDKSVCRVAGKDDLCTFAVSWSSNDPNATIRKVDLNNNQSSQQIAGGLSAIYSDPLPVGARIQYEISYRYNGSGPLTTLRTPEVRVLLNGIADATVQDIACEPNGNNGCDLKAHDPSSGQVPGEASTEGGAAVYSIPIRLPPGRNGMQPELALSYNSRSGNGIAGLGWSLSGFSAIHRCPRTAAQDTNGAAVSMNTNDALCLDGERLVLSDMHGKALASGSYGVADAYYRTEINDFARVTQYGGDLAGAATCFKVEHKSGDISYYGGVPASNGSCAGGGSRLVPQGLTAPMSWQIERREDASGNTIDYTYRSFGKGEKLPESIAYTGKGNQPGNRVVFLDYEDRPLADRSRSYLAGGLTERTQRLENIAVSIAGERVSSYYLIYTEPLSGTAGNLHNGRSALQRIRQCGNGRDELVDDNNDSNDNVSDNGGAEVCLPDTIVRWNDLPPDHVLRPLTVAGLPDPATLPNGTFYDRKLRPIGDLDGDGIREAVVTQQQDGGPLPVEHTWLVKQSADRVVQGLLDITGMTGDQLNLDTGSEADFDGDGRSDMVAGSPSGVLTLYRWSLPRGASFGATPALTFSSVAINGVPGGLTVVSSGDLDRDGRADLLIHGRGSNCSNFSTGALPNGNYAHLLCYYRNSTTSTSAVSFEAGVKVFEWTHTSAQGNLSAAGDVNGDGVADLIVQDEASPLSLSAALITHVLLSGMPGLNLPSGCTSGPLSQWHSCTPQAMNLPVDTSGYRSFGAAMRWHDVNGDGLSDLLYALPGDCDPAGRNCGRGRWDVQIANGRGFNSPVGIVGNTDALLMTSGWDQNRLRYAAQLPTADVDSDGKADLLYPVAMAARQCMAVPTSYQAANGDDNCAGYDWTPRSVPREPDLAMCTATVWMCGNDPASDIANTASGYSLPHVDQMPTPAFTTALTTDNLYSVRTQKAQFAAVDQSLYYMAGLRFVPVMQDRVLTYEAQSFSLDASAGSNRAAHRVAMTLDGPNGDNVVDDLYGDGLADLFTSAGCVTHGVSGANCHFVGDGTTGPATYATAAVAGAAPVSASVTGLNNGLRSFVNENVGVAENPQAAPILPDLVRAITKGQNDTTTWTYFPLSSQAGRASSQLPFYTLPSDGYVDADHFYFQSTMPIVGSMTSSPGNGSLIGFRSWRYGYSEAMYNRLGRGFQGFRGIFREQALLSADLPRAIREITLFHQKFPLTSLVESMRSGAPVASTATIADPLDWVLPFTATDYVWGCKLVNREQCSTDSAPKATGFDYPFLTQQTTTAYDPGRAEQGVKERVASTVVNNFAFGTTGNSGWDAYGNLVHTYTDAQDHAESFESIAFVTRKQTRSEATYSNLTGLTIWWPGRLDSTLVTTMPVDYGPGHPLPADLSLPTLPLHTNYYWNGDRTPASVVIEKDDTAKKRTTAFAYPSGDRNFGLSVSVSETFFDSVIGNQVTRTVQTPYAPSGDGYFPFKTVDAAGTETQLVYRDRDGQIRESTLPTGVYLRNYYDAFGRNIRAKTYKIGDTGRTLLAQPVHTAWNSCANGVCTGVGNGGLRMGSATVPAEAVAAYRITTVQNGSPTSVVWFDLLGREIKSAQRGFDGTFVATLSEYDNLGLLAKKSVPFFLATATAAAPFVATTTYDRAGRIKSKTSPGGNTAPGVALAAAAQVTSTYNYSGNRTAVYVAGNSNCAPANVCVNVSRHSGVLGLMRTQDALLGVTRYWADAAGRPVAIADANANAAYPLLVPGNRVTRASYDVLGHRISTSDPNQGNWSFVYNGIGELVTQTDARNVTTTIRRDPAGRPSAQTVILPAMPAGQGVPAAPAEHYRDEWTYLAATGLLGEMRRCMTSSGVLSCTGGENGTATWSERFDYDYGRMSKAWTSQSLRNTRLNYSTTIHYDANFGREKAVEYGQSGLKVQRIYSRFGALRDVIDADTGERYWGVGAADAYGNVTRHDYGNGMIAEYSYDPIRGQPLSRQWRSGASPQSLIAERVAYGYDALANLATQQRRVGTVDRDETYEYDALQRLLESNAPVVGGNVQYRYDPLGNLLSKSDFSLDVPDAYRYLPTVENRCGPNVATTVLAREGLGYDHTTSLCDANGNVAVMQRRAANGSALGGARSMRYDASNRPRAISDPAAPGAPTADFVYAPDGRRVYELVQERYTTSSNATATRIRQVVQAQRGYQAEFEDTATNWVNAVHRHELGEVSVVLKPVGSGMQRDVTYKALDRLGSPLGLMNQRGEFLQTNDSGIGTRAARLSLGAFGEAREADFTPRNPSGEMAGRLNLTPATRQGFTGHEHLDSLGLIHMNGRVYDYRLGRFLSVDPLIQFPANSQSLNPYSYIMNNPMAGTDPSGYAIRDKRRYLNGNGPCVGNIDCEVDKTFGGPVNDFRSSVGARSGRSTNGHERFTQKKKIVVATVEIGDLKAEMNAAGIGDRVGETAQEGNCAEVPDYCKDRNEVGAVSSEIAQVASDGADVVDKVAVGVVDEALSPVNYTPAGPIKRFLSWLGFVRASRVVGVTAGVSGSLRIGKKWKPRDISDEVCEMGCESIARQIQNHIGGEIKRIIPGEGYELGKYRGKSWGWSHHDVVVKDGRVYDLTTGSEGLPVNEFKDLWKYRDGIDFGF